MKIAIIGGGIVGSTAAYYLRKYGQEKVTIFDYGKGQATKAAAGIICPWFSKRRNKAWYQLARLGADFYQELVSDVIADGYITDFYKQTGVYLVKKKEAALEELYEIAKKRHVDSPLIGDLDFLTIDQVKQTFPDLEGFQKVLYASGAARVDGAQLVKTLLEAAKFPLISEKVSLVISENGYEIAGQTFDKVILASGAWLGEILEPLAYHVDVRPQKGQLCDYYFDDLVTDDYPLLMPEGEIDIIPFANGKLSVGASHENDKGYDLTESSRVLDSLEGQARHYFPKMNQAKSKSYRVGTRAYTSDFLPFFGFVPGMSGVYAASGLGSSGLTIGPLIGKELVNLLLEKETSLKLSDYSLENYVYQAKK
ncbi:NAD(P)/FAD-dependent oxidoreductase [Streptococcus iniae]|uniref:NAD(P)/FAD-dependent oxidoreductase n=1 Tax=Streptococcus iniae TaxID=1346 RepID=UPI00273D69A5|nr:FAD-dependent oxidoreductase [Streptococcus iniae]WLR88451.1 FAD-dependent oxidoreductase [Streptococcus iniae]WLR89176.1 FAD-dependent oxidoreductase [Streptococcus iniae]